MVAKMDLGGIEVSETDHEAIAAAALDYIEGWYNAAPEQTERSLHPHLAKRRVVTVMMNGVGRDGLDQMSAMELVQIVRQKAKRGDVTTDDQRTVGIKVLDVFGNAATVRLEMADWIDYAHLAKVNGEWKIVNVLWALR